MKNKNVNSTIAGTEVIYIPTNAVKIYMVKESQLNELERGNSSDLFLEIGIACVSIFASFLIALLTTQCNNKTFVAFVCITSVSFLGGATLLLLWYRSRKSKKTIIDEIRSNETKTNN